MRGISDAGSSGLYAAAAPPAGGACVDGGGGVWPNTCGGGSATRKAASTATPRRAKAPARRFCEAGGRIFTASPVGIRCSFRPRSLDRVALALEARRARLGEVGLPLAGGGLLLLLRG